VATSASSVQLRDAKNALRGSWVSPNARCPVCGSAVYFYCSSDGGRVYFDELGPPWPKHPCIDRTGALSRSSEPNAKRWDKDGWQPLVDFQVSLIASGSLYRIAGNALPYARTLLFRLDGPFEVEMVRFNERQGVEVELSMLARDRTSGEWLVCEGVGKIAPNFPPTEKLRVIDRIPNMSEPKEADLEPIGNGVLKSSRELWTLPPAKEPEQRTRVEEIDDRIRALLGEISDLNDEKTRLLRAAMSPAGDSSR
jgi:hypothetical protein